MSNTINPILLSAAGRMIFHILDNPGCTIADLQSALSLSIKGVRYSLERLLEENLVRCEGSGTGRGHHKYYYVVKDSERSVI